MLLDYYTADMVGLKVDCEVLGELVRSVHACGMLSLYLADKCLKFVKFSWGALIKGLM